MKKVVFPALALSVLCHFSNTQALAVVPINPSYTAYLVPTNTVGNQQTSAASQQSIGMDFHVNAPIMITSLGVFDSGGNGLLSPMEVRIYNLNSQISLANILFTPSNPGTLVGGSRFLDLPTPLVLATGFSGAISVSYTGNPVSEPDGNSRVSPGNWTTDDGGGLISFTGNGRHSGAGTGDVFPNVVDLPASANNFAAGTFIFSAIPTPEPGSVALIFSGVVVLAGFLSYRLLKANFKSAK